MAAPLLCRTVRRRRLSPRSRALVGLSLPVLLLVALLAAGKGEAVVFGVTYGAAYSLLALGIVLIYKSSGVFNFAQGEFGTVAVYTLGLLQTRLPYGFALVLALLAGVLMGLATERVVIRPLFEAARVTLLVATAGVALLAIGVEVWLGEAKLRPVSPLLENPERLRLLGVGISDQQLVLLGATVLVAIGLAWFFRRSALGVAIIGASQDAFAARVVGIDVHRLSSVVWGLAGLLGALAGVLSVPVVRFFGPGSLTFGSLIPAFTAAVVGGMTSLPGAFVGGLVVGAVQAAAPTIGLVRDIPGSGSLAVFLVLLAVLILRPEGIFGERA